MPIVMCIPTLSPQGAKRAAALIESAEAGACRPDLYFVVNNGGHFSSNNPRVEVYTPGTNIGVAPAWNEALRRFQNAVVVVSNDDIVVAHESVAKLVGALTTSGQSMAGTKGHSFSFFAMTDALVRKVGYFDEGFAPAYYEDTDYLRRMQIAGVERVIVETGATHQEQSTSRDMGWDAHGLMARQSIRYDVKWGGMPGQERFVDPWGIRFDVCVPSCRPDNLQRLIDSLAWQTVRPNEVIIASNADIDIDTRGLSVRQVKFWSDHYAIGEGDASLRRNVATWAAKSPYVVYSDDDQVWPQTAMEWFARRFSLGEFFVVGHHRFVEDMSDPSLRTADPSFGAPRENPPNATHLWQSCWAGSFASHADMIRFGVGGWDMGYPTSEDQQLARRLVGMGDDSEVTVHEPPWAWHLKDAPHQPPWSEPHSNVCRRDEHEMVPLATDTLRCTKCPLVRRVDGRWPIVQLYDPSKVRTEEIPRKSR